MNRKESILVLVALLVSFLGGAYGVTSSSPLTNVFVTNFPHNQNVTVTNFPKSPSPTTHTAAVDIEILNSVPGIIITPPTGNLTAGFGFTPQATFVQVTSAELTIDWSGTTSQGHVGDRFAAQLNGQPPTLSPPMQQQASMLFALSPLNITIGGNQINLYVIPAPGVTSTYLVYEVRLTLSYTFTA